MCLSTGFMNEVTSRFVPPLCSRLNNNKKIKVIGIIGKAKHQLNMTTLLLLYNSFVYQYFPYWIEIWGAASDVYLQQIIKLQTGSKNNKFFKVIKNFCSNISAI